MGGEWYRQGVVELKQCLSGFALKPEGLCAVEGGKVGGFASSLADMFDITGSHGSGDGR